MKLHTYMILALTAMVGLSTSLSHAQVLEEVVVTAQKREQGSQDLPMSVLAMTGDTAEKLGVTNSQELVKHIVNVTNRAALGEGSRPAYYMRGIGLSDFNSNNTGPVGVYLDEVYQSNMATQMVPLYDIERIEILRGPQGTLFGRNTSAGALSFFSRKPTQETEASLKGTIGNDGLRRLEVVGSTGLTDNLSGRVSVLKVDSDGFLHNVAGSGMEGARDLAAWRAQLAWDGEAASVLFSLHGSEDNSDSAGYSHLGQLSPVDFSQCGGAAILAGQCVDALGYSGAALTDSDFYSIASDLDRSNDTETLGGVLNISWDLSDEITITSITGYDEADQMLIEDADASPNNVVTTVYGTDVETFSQELRAVGSTENTHWIAGIYYMTEDMSVNQSADILRVLRPVLGFDPDNFVIFSRHLLEQDTDSYAVFGQVEYDLTESLILSVGLRWTNEKRDFSYTTILEEPTFEIPLFEQSDDIDDDDISGRVALDYQFNDDVKLYASVSKGFKAGGFNGGFLFEPTPETSYDAETVIAYEVGMKSEFLDNTMRFNAAVFYYDYSDMQAFTFINTGGLPTQVLTNASDAQVLGLEAEIDWLVTENLSFFLGLGLLDSELKDFKSAGEDYSGNQLPLAPEFNAVGMAFYSIPLENDANITLQVDFSYDDDVFFQPSNDPLYEQEGYALFNARASYTPANERFEVALWGKNLGDKEYYSAMFDLSDFGLIELMPGAARSYGLDVTLRF